MCMKSVVWSSIGIGIGHLRWCRYRPEIGRFLNLNNVKRNARKRRNMYVNYKFQVFQCLSTLFKKSYIDCTFHDESPIESKIIKLIYNSTVILYK